MRKGLFQHVRSLINKVSKWPAVSSYRWDERISLVAFIVFHAVTLARLLFPLQWVKLCHRKIFGRDRYFQKRTNFHSLFTEIYFVSIILILIAIDRLPGSSSATSVKVLFGTYFAVESIIWTAYYLFFRHFIERSFTIYHRAEYFLGFSLALAVQMLGIGLATGAQCDSGLVERSLRGLGFLFNSTLELPTDACTQVPKGWISNGLALLGVCYVVVLLANLRDAFPKTQVKPTTAVGIIGAGDVVKARLLPALIKPLPRSTGAAQPSRRFEPVEIHPDAVHIFDVGDGIDQLDSIELQLEFPNGRTRRKRITVKRELSSQDVVVEVAAERIPTIIASPPDSHFFYVATLAMHGIRFAVEKPITVFEPEVRMLAREGERLFADGFAMSYYALEKALPLTYLYTMHPLHRNHLDLYVLRGDYRSVDTLPWNEVVGGLGPPLRIQVLLLEGMARSPKADVCSRQWTEDPHLGGLYYETAIHAVTVLHKVLGDLTHFDPTLEALVSEKAVRSDSCSFVHMQVPSTTPPSGQPAIDLLVGKYMPEHLCARGAVIEYATATIHCDFDSMILNIRPKGAHFEGSDVASVAIAVRERYAQVRYAVQASLIRTFFEYGWQGSRFDDYTTQLSVLSWLSRYRAKLLASQASMKTYTTDGIGLPSVLPSLVATYRQHRPDRGEYRDL